MIKKFLYSAISASILFSLFQTEHFSFSKELTNNEIKEDISNIAWTYNIPNLLTARNGLKTVEYNDKIYIIGGENNLEFYSNVEVYDIKNNSWEVKSPMPTPRKNFAMLLVDNEIYCLGGITANGPTNKVEIYNIETDTWRSGKDLTSSKGYIDGAFYNDNIYLFGGASDENLSPTNTISKYNIKTQSEELLDNVSLPIDLMGYSLIQNGDKVYITGGSTKGDFISDSVFMYNLLTNNFDEIGKLNTARRHHSSILYKNQILTFGGEISESNSFETIDKTEIFDLNSNISSENISMDSSRKLFATQTIDDKLYIIGGSNKKNTSLSDISTYNLEYIHKPSVLNSNSTTSKIDVYIKPENTLSLSVDTNSVTFEDYNGLEDIESLNSINMSVVSSLPYVINAYLETPINNSDSSDSIDFSLLKIRESSQPDYKTFPQLKTKLELLGRQEATDNRTHSIDLKLEGGETSKASVFRTTLKIELAQI